jgi:hypothetical protein
MNIFMDDLIEQELRRLADEQGRDLVEVVETALRNYIVSETFAGDDAAGPGVVEAGRSDGVAVVPDAEGDAVFDADSVFGHLPLSEADSVVEGPFAADGALDLGLVLDLDGLGDLPPAADSDTVIVGSVD